MYFMRKVVKNKRNSIGQMNISFGLIFAIIAGAFILGIAIYGVVKFVEIEEKALEGEVGKTIGILTNPLESSFESSQTITITTPVETRIFTGCYFQEPTQDNGEPYFGLQRISTSQRNKNSWTDITMNTSFKNKFIFSENPSQGKKFYIFSKPLNLPYKIADLIYILSKDKTYCFLDADTIRQGDLKEEIDNLNQPKLLTEECPEDSVNVCFYNQAGCDIRIDYNSGELVKNGERFYFAGDAMMFAALFSSKDAYDCQVSRLIQRALSLSEIYNEKYDLMIKEIECDSDMKIELSISYYTVLKNYETPRDLNAIKYVAEELQTANEWSDCKLW